VFSHPEVVRRANSEFIPVALKAGTVNGPPDSEEGRLYREIGRSKVAPQGICVANSAGKVLAWTVMFDNDASVLGFLDYTLKRYGSHPGAETAVAAERFMRYPSEKAQDMADSGQRLTLPPKHPDGERCLGAFGVPEGTLAGRAWGRAFKDGNPLGDPTRQENYIEDRFEVPVDQQEALARTLAPAGGGPFELPEGLALALVATAHLGMLDVNPLGVHGGQNDRKEWSFRGRKDGDRIRFEGTSLVAGSGTRGDGALWSHEVKLSWKVAIEMKGDRITKLLSVAGGHEKLKWVNLHIQEGQSEVASLTGGHPIDFDGEVRYGFEGRPVAPQEIGSSPEAGPHQGPPGDLPPKMQKFQAALQRAQKEGKDLSEVGKILEGFDALMKEGRFKEAGERLDRALKLLGSEGGQAAPPGDVPESLRAKIQQLHEAVQAQERRQKEIEHEIQKFPPLVQKGDFAEAEKQIDRILELLKKR
jgi:hypothetical protein